MYYQHFFYIESIIDFTLLSVIAVKVAASVNVILNAVKDLIRTIGKMRL